MPAVTDRTLWRRAAAGEAEAFGEIYERHADAIYNFCFRRTADWALAEDLTAIVFLEAWKKRRRVIFDAEDAVRPWLFGVANNVVRTRPEGIGDSSGHCRAWVRRISPRIPPSGRPTRQRCARSSPRSGSCPAASRTC